MADGPSYEVEISDGPRPPARSTPLPPGVYLDAEGDVTMASAAPAIMKLIWWTHMRWLFAGMVLGLLLNAQLIAVEGMTTSNTVTLWACIIIIGLIPVVMLVAGYTGRRPLRVGHLHYVARTDGYTLRGASSSMTHAWHDFKKAYVDHNTIYLMLDGGNAQLIPLGIVADPKPLIDHLKQLGLLRPTPKTFYFF